MTIYDSKLPYPMQNHPLTEKEIWLINLCREMEFGSLVVYLEKRQPSRVEDYRKSMKPPI